MQIDDRRSRLGDKPSLITFRTKTKNCLLWGVSTAGQKLFFWGMFYSVILLLLSGVALWYTETLPWSLRFVRYAAILIHASVAMITIGLFPDSCVHEHDPRRGKLGSMIHGNVTRAWAWTFHRTWYYEVAGRSRPKQ